MPFGVRERRSGGDMPDGAGGGAADDDGLGACLGRDEQVASPDARVDELRAGQPQDAVRPRMLVSLGVAVGEERRIAAAESGWHEARALDWCVPASAESDYWILVP